jgi:hypothetical protein
MARFADGIHVHLTADLRNVLMAMTELGASARAEFTPGEARQLASLLLAAAKLAEDFADAAKTRPVLRSVP